MKADLEHRQLFCNEKEKQIWGKRYSSVLSRYRDAVMGGQDLQGRILKLQDLKS